MEGIIITNREEKLNQFNVNNNEDFKKNYNYLINNQSEIGEISYISKEPVGTINNIFQEKHILEDSHNNNSFFNKTDIDKVNSIKEKKFENQIYQVIINEKIKENSSNKINAKNLIKEYIGHISEAHHYILDNEFILKGYRINFNSCKRISKSICMCHNETINVWTHIIGSILTILFMFLVIFNIGPINQESILKSYFEMRGKLNQNKNLTEFQSNFILEMTKINKSEENKHLNKRMQNDNNFSLNFLEENLKSTSLKNIINNNENNNLNKNIKAKKFIIFENYVDLENIKQNINFNMFKKTNEMNDIKNLIDVINNEFKNYSIENLKNINENYNENNHDILINNINKIIKIYNQLVIDKGDYEYTESINNFRFLLDKVYL